MNLELLGKELVKLYRVTQEFDHFNYLLTQFGISFVHYRVVWPKLSGRIRRFVGLYIIGGNLFV